MPKRRGWTETVVGIFVLASLALLFLLVVLIGRRQAIFEKRYEITGMFDTVAGLQAGADVLLAGINVGYVEDIKFGKNNNVEVVMTISRSQMERVRADSIACIRTMGLMGDRYVEVTIGSAEEPVIPPGGTINTSELFELGELLEEARPALGNLQKAISNISLITEELTDPTGDVANIIQNVRIVSNDVRKGQGTLGALLSKDDIYRKTSDVLDTTQQTVENFKEVSRNARDASNRLDGIMTAASSSVEKFGKFSDQATEASAELVEMFDAGQKIVEDAQILVSNLKSASEDIKEATPKVGPLIESADEGVSEARDAIEAAKRSWLIRGYLAPAAPGVPIAVSGRDIAQPEVP